MEATNPHLDTLLLDWVRLSDARGVSPRARAAYALEANIFHSPHSLDLDQWFPDIAAASRYALSVTASEHLPSAYVVAAPELTDRATAFTLWGRTTICLPAERNAFWTRATILHELAHVAVGTHRGHDRTWARVFTELVREHLSPRAARRLTTGFATMPDLLDGACLSVENLTELASCV